jgi:hypothetical protein
MERVPHRYDQYPDAWDTSVVLEVDGETVRYFHTHVKGVHRVFVDHPLFLAKACLVGQCMFAEKALSILYCVLIDRPFC